MFRSFNHSTNRIYKYSFQQKRFRYKKKWASNKKQKTPEELALQHFDTYYPPIYKDLWPATRIALLSQKKTSALLNNFADVENTHLKLLENGGSDIFQRFRESQINKSIDKPETPAKDHNHELLHKRLSLDCEDSERHEAVNVVRQETHTDLYDFMPVKIVASEKEQQRHREIEQNTFVEKEIYQGLTVEEDELFSIPEHLKAYACDIGDVSLFPPAKPADNDLLEYFLLDAGSLLPVLALDLYRGCSVLDLCAAPGGKTLAMLQTMLPGSVTCVDHSHARISRLKEVLRNYVPPMVINECMSVYKTDGIKFCAETSETFDRVLVDVPCFTDRHVLNSDESSMFKGGSIGDRLEIQQTQENLLMSGIKCCNPGGYVVYSTCTLSPTQNDGIIHKVIERIWTENKINVTVKNTKHFPDSFRHCMNFYNNCRFGQLVMPLLTANFGPMYFCKLKRLD